MVRTIRKVGNDYMIPLEKSLMEQLGLREGDDVVLSVREGVLIVTAASTGLTDEEREDMVDRFYVRYDGVIKDLSQ